MGCEAAEMDPNVDGEATGGAPNGASSTRPVLTTPLCIGLGTHMTSCELKVVETASELLAAALRARARLRARH
jgi:hypothetical protein